MSDQETPNVDDSVEPEILATEQTLDEGQTVPDVEAADQAPTADDVEALQTELQAAKDEALRQQAEAQNVRRRAEKDVENARRYSIERIAKDILPVLDNLERALETVGEESNAFVEGVQLTLKTFVDTLAKHSIEAISPEGEPFDPQLHEAISMVPNPDVEPNTVLNVVQKGYSLNGRVIRAAMVIVSQS